MRLKVLIPILALPLFSCKNTYVLGALESQTQDEGIAIKPIPKDSPNDPDIPPKGPTETECTKDWCVLHSSPILTGASDIDVLDDGHAIAVGNQGGILLSADYFASLAYIDDFPTTGKLTRVAGDNPQEAFIAGSDSNNSGASIWHLVLAGDSYQADVLFNTAQQITGERTTYADHINSFVMPDGSSFFAVGGLTGGYGFLLQLDADGNFRVGQAIDGNLLPELRDVLYAGSTDDLIVAGDDGLLMVSHDAGEHFDIISTGIDADLFEVDCGDQLCIAVGQGGNYLVSHDLGDSWTAMHLNNLSVDLASAVVWTDDETIWIGGEKGTILRSDDGGQNWVTQQTGLSDCTIEDIHMASLEQGWASCANNATYSGAILQTVSGGE